MNGKNSQTLGSIGAMGGGGRGGSLQRRLPWALLAVLALVLVIGCKKTETASSGAASAASTGGTVSYPLSTTVTLNYWLELHTNISPNFANIGDNPFAKGLQEKTGVKINFLHPPSGSGAALEQLNLMIAAGDDMPDMVEYNWLTMTGGPEKYISDGVILKLNDTIDKYAPNLKAYLKAHPDFDRMVKTDDSSYYTFPFIRGEDILLLSQGLMIRKDWLDELNLAVPDTLDDWHTVLTAFKNRKGSVAPFTQTWSNNSRMFMTTFGIMKDWYIGAEDGKARFGQQEPGYRRWMETMAQWYKEGLIDKDIISIQTAQQNQKMTSGTSGATVASVGSGMGTWTVAAQPNNPKYEILALPDPVMNKGDKRVYQYVGLHYTGQNSVAISAKSKNVELAARFLDYGYSQAGHLYYNFGTEGTSYTMVNGKPTYTDLIMKNPNGWAVAQAMAAYVRGNMAGPFIQDGGYITQYYAMPEQLQALTNYNVPEARPLLWPPVIATQAESRELASIMNDINTYTNEMTTKFILGTEALNDASWNTYLSNIKRMNIDRAIAIQSAALDRYKKR